MSAQSNRLDRFLSQTVSGLNRKAVRLLLAQGRVTVDGQIAREIHQSVDFFSQISLDGEILQANQAHYVMLHKPKGVVSATQDPEHRTVIDLLDHPDKHSLHIVGRLDLNSSGLLLLTNDGRWSSRLTDPEHKVEKRYQVTLENPVTEDYISAFAEGMYFPFEEITTRPAQLTLINDYQVEVVLTEGRYHQIKRMFGRFRNPVLALHRVAIGSIQLDSGLAAGDSRDLSPEEWRL
ncbi:16S rRNA pseudouridine516 synthase [Oceanospirillum multiglobuliferum]|uniref:Pseudouridine synthase n=1 Tax=Oceanospirillum multiglobuliferum TaxID=64969 RepID=A0A1T4MX06_9GAMM|nr:16S rRNA pseudouridine(516) synthase [Oceanospirillum multiglobuliferum]OPX56859.1 16S rRNA pseudouridine(516) synthase [Oceanospirillum multiglobuliferum]SJZ71386.1 16S rRNA pseudouridine516 synthase [Oceanospirillum multiglobuliferum]